MTKWVKNGAVCCDLKVLKEAVIELGRINC